MRILVLADPRTGHLRQCLGLVRVIERDRSVETVEIPVRPHRLASDLVRRGLAMLPKSLSARVLNRCFGINARDVSGFDLVIGSGRPSILAGILISRMTGARFVYCGRVSGYDARDFGLVLVPYAQDGHLPRHAFAPIPSPVDPARFPLANGIASPEALKGADVTLLVGGPSARRAWSMPDWAHLAYFLMAAEHQLGVRWSIATSPRTPDEARGLLAATFSALETRGAWVDFKEAGPGSAEPLLGSDIICVTSDSTSMIAEGLAAMRPVIGIASRRLKSSRDDAHLAMIASEGSFADLALAGLTPERFGAAVIQLKVPLVDPRDAIRSALEPLLAGIVRSG